MTAKKWHYIVGDIHGCYQEFLRIEKNILKHAQESEAQALIISCGDIVDRGPQSREVIEHFWQGNQLGTHDFVLGNHEVMMLEVIHSYRPDLFEKIQLPTWFTGLKFSYENGQYIGQDQSYSEYRDDCRTTWITQGGLETLQSFAFDAKNPRTWNFPKELLNFIITRPFSLKIEQALITHALPTTMALETYEQLKYQPTLEEDIELYAIQEAIDILIWNRRELDTTPPEGEVWVSGHTPGEGVRRLASNRVLQIDTNCCEGGYLTAWCVEENRFFRAQFKESDS